MNNFFRWGLWNKIFFSVNQNYSATTLITSRLITHIYCRLHFIQLFLQEFDFFGIPSFSLFCGR